MTALAFIAGLLIGAACAIGGLMLWAKMLGEAGAPE